MNSPKEFQDSLDSTGIIAEKHRSVFVFRRARKPSGFSWIAFVSFLSLSNLEGTLSPVLGYCDKIPPPQSSILAHSFKSTLHHGGESMPAGVQDGCIASALGKQREMIAGVLFSLPPFI